MNDIERQGRYLRSIRLGAIDVGSNSVHMIVADVSREGHLEVVDRVKQVARLALKLFDATAPVLSLPRSSRELLEFGALLHDIVHAIDHFRHNRH